MSVNIATVKWYDTYVVEIGHYKPTNNDIFADVTLQ